VFRDANGNTQQIATESLAFRFDKNQTEDASKVKIGEDLEESK